MSSFVLGLIVGYCVCVLFPVPWLSAAVIRGWAAIGAKLRGAPTNPPV